MYKLINFITYANTHKTFNPKWNICIPQKVPRKRREMKGGGDVCRS